MYHKKMSFSTLSLLFSIFIFVKIKEIKSEEFSVYEVTSSPYHLNKISQRNVLKNKNNTDVVTINPKLVCFYVFTNDFECEIMNGLCTHIIVGFLEIDANNSIYAPDENLKILSDVVALKKMNKNLKVMISVGGYGANNFGVMVTNHKTRKVFIKSVIQLIKEYKLDGLDLDWEWPAINGDPQEKIKFIQLLHEIRVEFNRHKKIYILSADVSASVIIDEISYYVQHIAENVDFVNIMGYDYRYYSQLLPLTGHNAPLYGHNDFFQNFNVNVSINYWISKSMPREKILLGIPTYGHTFWLKFPNQVSLNAPAIGPGSIGSEGFADYQQICKFIKESNTTVLFDDISKVPFAYNYPNWVSFDNEISLIDKATYILDEKLGGGMVFSVNADDYSGSCSENQLVLPLIKKIRSILLNEV